MALVGFILLIFGVTMLIIHLTGGRGMIVDPVSISWLGYIMFIPVAILLAAASPEQDIYGVRGYVLAMYVAASVFYAIGLYSGRATLVSRVLPVPSKRLNLAQVWTIIAIAGVLFGFFWTGTRLLPSAVYSIIFGLNLASVGAMVLLGFYAIICYRGHYMTKLLTGILSFVMVLVLYYNTWSRRPIFAVLFSGVCLFYYRKLLWRPAAIRIMFWGLSGFLGVCFLFYLNATRGQRYYGIQSTAESIFSARNLDDFAGGLSVGHFVFEKVVDDLQNGGEFGFQYGKTYVPGLVFWIPRTFWPGKPNTGGGIATTIWFNTATDAPSNVSPTPIGEAYINFGFLGAVIVPLVAGWFVRGFNTYLLGHPDNEVLWLVWFAVIPDFATQWRGDFTSMFVQAFMRVSLIIILAWVTKRIGQGSDYLEAGEAIQEYDYHQEYY